MARRAKRRAERASVVVIGGGFSGSLLALKLAAARPNLKIHLVERRRRIGRGLAYGACMPDHLLNVPVSRMELGFRPSFAEWLSARPDEIADALAESGGELSGAYVPRELFGQYLQGHLNETIASDPHRAIAPMQAEAVRLLDLPRRGVLLDDGREIEADIVVLATGNLAPKPPPLEDEWLYDSNFFVADPWAPDAFADIGPDAPVLLLGTGLTTVDIALKLWESGHRGPMHAVSRRGLLPTTHRSGGMWQPFVSGLLPASPLALAQAIRSEVRKAQGANIPWQRVIDAVRPAIAAVWHSWSGAQRAQFLRHGRARWDVHRHRMAPRIGEKLQSLLVRGALRISRGRIRGYRRRDNGVEAIMRSGGMEKTIFAERVVNCTGPRSDFDTLALPLFADLKRRGLIVPDPLGLGIETDDCAVLDRYGTPSHWLFALGPLTRPAWWEITAVPEIAVQVERLVKIVAAEEDTAPRRLLAEHFDELGAGI